MKATILNRLNTLLGVLIAMLTGVMLTCCNGTQQPVVPEEEAILLWPAADNTGFWGFINEKGEMVIPAKYDYTYGFSEEKAKVIIDEDSKPMSLPHGYPYAVSEARVAFIDMSGKIIYNLPESTQCDNYFYNGYCRFNQNGKFGMYDADFHITIPADYTSLGQMTSDGLVLATAGVEEHSMYINKAGDIAIIGINGVLYDRFFHISDFCNGIAVIGHKGYTNEGNFSHYGAINTKGELVIDTTYFYLQSVEGNRLIYQLETDNAVGLMDTKGNIITEPSFNRYDYGTFSNSGLMPVKGLNASAGYGYIDKNGTVLIPYQYEEAWSFSDNVAWTMPANKTWTLIDSQGKIVLTLETTQKPYSDFYNGMCVIYDFADKQYKYINKQGKTIYSWLPVNQ